MTARTKKELRDEEYLKARAFTNGQKAFRNAFLDHQPLPSNPFDPSETIVHGAWDRGFKSEQQVQSSVHPREMAIYQKKLERIPQ